MKKVWMSLVLIAFLISCQKTEQRFDKASSTTSSAAAAARSTGCNQPLFSGSIDSYYDEVGRLHNELMDRFYHSMQQMDPCKRKEFGYGIDTSLSAFFAEHCYEFNNAVEYYQKNLEKKTSFTDPRLSDAANEILAQLERYIDTSKMEDLEVFARYCRRLEKEAHERLGQTDLIAVVAALGTAEYSARYWYDNFAYWERVLSNSPCFGGVRTQRPIDPRAKAVLQHDVAGAISGAIGGAAGGPVGAFIGGLLGGGTKSVIHGFCEGFGITRFTDWLGL